MNRNYIRDDEHEVIEREFDAESIKNRARMLVIGTVFLAVVLAFCATITHAQTACTVGGSTTCFVASKTTGESPISTVLTWNVIGATSCTAGGAGTVAAWTGAVPASGTRTLSGIAVKFTLTLDCVAPATSGKMRLTWTPNLTNTDNSPLTNLGGYVISYGTSASTLNQTVNLAVPSASAYDLTGLTAGTWFASLQAATTACFPTTLADCHVSVPSNVASMAVTTTPGGALPRLSLVIDPYTVPKPPSALTASDAIAYDIRPDSTGKLLAQRIGIVRPGTLCASEERKAVDGIEYFRVDRTLVDVVNFSNGADAWVPVVYARCT